MTERKALQNYRAARKAYDDAASYITAAEVLKTAQILVEISDDYQDILDEADDIVAEPV